MTKNKSLLIVLFIVIGILVLKCDNTNITNISDGNVIPEAPFVEGEEITNSTIPSWNWIIPQNATNIRFRINKEDWIYTNDTITSNYSPSDSLDDGIYIFEIQAGNSDDWSSSSICTTIIDLIAPNAPSVNGTSPVNSVTPSWNWTFIDSISDIRLSLDSGIWKELGGATLTSFTPGIPLSEGEHILKVEGRDKAGNWSASGSFTILIDTTPPVIPKVSGESPTSITKPTWTWNIPDDAVYIRCKLNGSSWITNIDTSSTSYTPKEDLVEGNHIFEVQVADNAGNWSESGICAITVKLEIIPPDAPYVSGDSITNNLKPTWSWDVPESIKSFRIRLDSTNWETTNDISITSYTPALSLSEGVHILEVIGVNNENIWSEPGYFKTIIDITPPEKPTVSGLTPTNDTTPVWTWDIPLGAINFRFKIDGGEWETTGDNTTTSYSPSIGLSCGSHTLEVQASDNVGNWSESGIFEIYVNDVVPPEAPSVNGITPTNSSNPTWSWDIPESAVNFKCKLNSGDWDTLGSVSITSFSPIEALPEGTHILEVQAADSSGNWSESGTFTIEIDQTAPNAPVVTGESPTGKSKPTWEWSMSTDVAKIRYKLKDSTSWIVVNLANITSYTPITPFEDGIYTLEVQVADAAGNWSVSGEGSITVDLTPPGIPVVTGDSVTIDTFPTWTWDVPAEAVGFRFKLNNNNWTIIESDTFTTYTPITPLESGKKYIMEVQAKDNLNNWSESGICTTIVLLPAPLDFSASDDLVIGAVICSWKSVKGAERYKVYRAPRHDYVSFGYAGTTENTSFRDIGFMQPSYCYKVVAFNDETGESGFSNYDYGSAKMPAPTSVSATNGTVGNGITVSWSKVGMAKTYQVFRATSMDGSYSYKGSTSSTSYTDNSASQGVTYYYKVMALYDAVKSSLSAAASGYKGLSAPQNLKASDGTSSLKVDLSWSSVAGANGYRIYRATSSSGEYTMIKGTTGTSNSDNSALKGITYYYKVMAYSSSPSMQSSYSNVDSGYLLE